MLSKAILPVGWIGFISRVPVEPYAMTMYGIAIAASSPRIATAIMTWADVKAGCSVTERA